jgi:G3E family GTPase
MASPKIPVTVLTGFLGSGKTTLLNRILTEPHGLKIAVIENEFGEIGIDQDLVINADEEVFEMSNGCICCTVRGDLIRILGGLARRKGQFDRVIVETTGLADPGPVAQTFFMDDEVREHYALDGIVTLVDAGHVLLHLDDSDECRQQVAFADVLVLNKCDLVTPVELDRLEQRIRGMNAMARVHRATYAGLPVAQVLDIGGFDLDRALQRRPDFLVPEYPFEWAGAYVLGPGAHELVLGDGPDPTMDVLWMRLEGDERVDDKAVAERAMRLWAGTATRVRPAGTLAETGRRSRLETSAAGEKRYRCEVPSGGRYGLFTEHLASEFSLRVEDAPPPAEHLFAAGHEHDDEVGSVGIHLEGGVDEGRLNAWLGELLREKGADIFRMKGILDIHGSDKRFVFQCVHMLFDGREDRPWGDDARSSDLVFIGRNLDRDALTKGFLACRA